MNMRLIIVLIPLICLQLGSPFLADNGSTPVSIFINDELVHNAETTIGENGQVYGKLGSIAETIGITSEDVTTCEDFVPAAVFLKTHGFEVELRYACGDVTELYAFREYGKDPYELYIPDSWKAFKGHSFFVELRSSHWNGAEFVDFDLAINGRRVDAGMEVRENGRAYARMGPLAEAVGYTDEEIISSEDYIPIAGFFRSHGFIVEWVEGVFEHPYVAVYRMRN